MPSLPIHTPHLEALRRFCSEHTVNTECLFELTWALIVHCYFDTNAFLFDNGKNDDLKDDGVDRILVSFLPELAKTSSVIENLQKNRIYQQGKEEVLAHSSAKGFDRSLHRIYSRLHILRRSCNPQGNGEVSRDIEGEVSRSKDVSEARQENYTDKE